jgi:hypothetical protein
MASTRRLGRLPAVAERPTGWAAETVNSQDALFTTAEIAITLAGFSGIVAVLGRRGHGEWQPQFEGDPS